MSPGRDTPIEGFDLRRMRALLNLLRSLVLLSLAACGGGSSNMATNQPPPTNPVSPPAPVLPNYDTLEFQQSWGLGAINPLDAYNSGTTGSGITLAIIDTGIDTDHPDLAENLSPASTDIVTSRNVLQGEDPHGTLVASIAAAQKNNFGSHGVAFEATILAIRADSPGSCADEEDDCAFYDSTLAQAVRYATQNGADVINFSLSGDSPHSLDLTTALDAAVAADIIIVMSAGNDGDPDPDASTGYAFTSGANSQALIVGSVAEAPDSTAPSGFDLTISEFSDRAGDSQSRFLVAPGDRVTASGDDGTLFYVTGTSFSAPHVTGAAALLLQAFPSLTAKEVVQILLDTTTDLGAVGSDAIFGSGLLNLAEAFSPQGPLSVPTNNAAGPELFPYDLLASNSTLNMGPAFGDSGLGMGPIGLLSRTLVFDKYDRTYIADLSHNISARQGGSFSLAGAARHSVYRRNHEIELLEIGFIEFGYTEEWGSISKAQLFPNRLLGDSKHIFATSLRLTSALSRATDIIVAHGFSAGGIMSKAVLGPSKPLSFKSTGSAGSAFLGLSRGGTNIGLSHRLSPQTEVTVVFGTSELDLGDGERSLSRRATAAQVTRRIGEAYRVGIQFGILEEDGSVLETVGRGAFDAVNSATTRFIALTAAAEFNNWTFMIQGSQGTTAISEREGLLLHSFGSLRTSAYRAAAYWRAPLPGHVLGFSVAQPLRVESGGALVKVPTGRDLTTEAFSFTSQAVNFSPSGREVNFELSHAFYSVWGRSLQTSLIYQMDPNHSKTASDAFSVIAEFHSRF